jgi:hypothetical protein
VTGKKWARFGIFCENSGYSHLCSSKAFAGLRRLRPHSFARAEHPEIPENAARASETHICPSCREGVDRSGMQGIRMTLHRRAIRFVAGCRAAHRLELPGFPAAARASPPPHDETALEAGGPGTKPSAPPPRRSVCWLKSAERMRMCLNEKGTCRQVFLLKPSDRRRNL